MQAVVLTDNGNRQARVVSQVLKLIGDLEEALNSNEDSPLKGLDLAIKPVGSVTEGTRVGTTNEMDFMVFFRYVL